MSGDGADFSRLLHPLSSPQRKESSSTSHARNPFNLVVTHIENVATIDMALGGASSLTMDGGLIDFGGSTGTLKLTGGSATIGELTVSAGSITGSGSVNVETYTTVLPTWSWTTEYDWVDPAYYVSYRKTEFF
jgi:hypothetical protein